MADTRTPAQELREAAKLMRERAAEAEQSGYESTHPGKPWCPAWTYSMARHVHRNMDSDCVDHPWGSDQEGECNQWGRYAGHHIASWHPAVALAVADWLEDAAKVADLTASLAPPVPEGERPISARTLPALAVARAYLGESTDAT